MFNEELANAWTTVKAASPGEHVKLPAGRYACRITTEAVLLEEE